MSLTNLPPRQNLELIKKRKKYGFLKITLFSLLFIVLAGVVYGGYLVIKFDNMLATSSLPSSSTQNADEKTNNPVADPKTKLTTILLLGLDTRKETGSLNTDVIMVASFKPDGKTASIVSIPRDTYMKPEGFRARKANAFYSVAMNADKEQAKSVIKTIFGGYLDITIDYVTIINFKTFEDIIDRLGGIEIDVKKNMRYEDPTDGTNINLKKGRQTLDGKNALDYVRYRKSSDGSTAESSDYERNARQQEVISAIVHNAKSVHGLLNLGGIFDAVGDNIKTDFVKEDLRSFILTYIGLGNDQIKFFSLNGEWKSPYSYVSKQNLEEAKVLLKQE